MTFIDDCTKLQAVMYLRRKSDAFEAFKHSKCTLRTSSMQKSRLYRMTRLVNTCQLLSTSSWTSVALLGATAPGIGPQQNGVAEQANHTISDYVTTMLNEANYQLLSGLWLSLLMLMCGIGSLLQPYQVQLPILNGSSKNQTYLTSGCLGALPMSISSKISENLCSLTWSLGAIHLVTRAGSSIIQ